MDEKCTIMNETFHTFWTKMNDHGNDDGDNNLHYHMNYHNQIILNLLLGVKWTTRLPFMRMNEGTMMGPKQDKLFCSSCKVFFFFGFWVFYWKKMVICSQFCN
jgi:hypothetical protein